jgi:hypothetical protein
VQAPGPLFEMAPSELRSDAQGGALCHLFANSKITPTETERVVAGIIWRHQGRANAISIEMLTKATGKDERAIKGIVEQLVTTHRARIGGYRGGESGARVGYAVIVDAEDLAATVGPYRSQILSMWRRLRVLLSARELAELHGQLRLEE